VTIRSFIAIEVDRAIIDRLAALQQELRQADADVSWTRPAGIHLTLKFLGDVQEDRLPQIGEMLAALASRTSAFPLSIADTGGFPSLRRPRVIWAGIDDGRAAISALVVEVDAAMNSVGFAREERSFRPHLTLGRVKSSSNLAQLVSMVEAHRGEVFGAMQATELVLMRSELLPTGARYTALQHHPFTGTL
jgi:2'-5' RNA ligase